MGLTMMRALRHVMHMREAADRALRQASQSGMGRVEGEVPVVDLGKRVRRRRDWRTGRVGNGWR
jgi:hypothetical protein